METLIIKETAKTPSVNFNANLGLIELEGRAIPEDSKKFFLPLINWVQTYCTSPCKHTTVNFKLEYFSTSSSKLILELFRLLESIHKANKSVVINWYYESDDDDMIEAIDTYISMLNIPFNKIETIFPQY